jgi:hypothetical protein
MDKRESNNRNTLKSNAAIFLVAETSITTQLFFCFIGGSECETLPSLKINSHIKKFIYF